MVKQIYIILLLKKKKKGIFRQLGIKMGSPWNVMSTIPLLKK